MPFPARTQINENTKAITPSRKRTEKLTTSSARSPALPLKKKERCTLRRSLKPLRFRCHGAPESPENEAEQRNQGLGSRLLAKENDYLWVQIHTFSSSHLASQPSCISSWKLPVPRKYSSQNTRWGLEAWFLDLGCRACGSGLKGLPRSTMCRLNA